MSWKTNLEVDTNSSRCQFHQRFSHAFFVPIFGTKLNVTRENDVQTKSLYVKCWWNWLQVPKWKSKNINLQKYNSRQGGQKARSTDINIDKYHGR